MTSNFEQKAGIQDKIHLRTRYSQHLNALARDLTSLGIAMADQLDDKELRVRLEKMAFEAATIAEIVYETGEG